MKFESKEFEDYMPKEKSLTYKAPKFSEVVMPKVDEPEYEFRRWDKSMLLLCLAFCAGFWGLIAWGVVEIAKWR